MTATPIELHFWTSGAVNAVHPQLSGWHPPEVSFAAQRTEDAPPHDGRRLINTNRKGAHRSRTGRWAPACLQPKASPRVRRPRRCRSW
jgi:hypothetical protein